MLRVVLIMVCSISTGTSSSATLVAVIISSSMHAAHTTSRYRYVLVMRCITFIPTISTAVAHSLIRVFHLDTQEYVHTLRSFRYYVPGTWSW